MLGSRDALSFDIAAYNSFVDGFGEAAIESDWKAIASTETVNARENSGISGDGGAPVYNLAGERVANDYADFLDGSLEARISTSEDGSTYRSKGCWCGRASLSRAARPRISYTGYRTRTGNRRQK